MTRMVWGRALAVWLLILLVETIHGVHRARWLVPFVWGFRARQAGAFTGSLYPWTRIKADCDAAHGGLIVFGLLLMALTPFIAEERDPPSRQAG